MLSMSKMRKKKHKLSPEIQAIDNEPQPEQSMLSMANLPSRGRRRQRIQEEVIREAAKPVKILTISDLPKRNRVARRVAINAGRIQRTQIGMGKQDHIPLGPKTFSDYVKNNAWKGRRCFIIGGGPSIKKMDLDLLRGEMTIGINRAYELLDPSILYGVDGQMWGWVEQGKCGEESKKRFNAYRGYKVWMALHTVFPPDFYLIDVDDRGGYRIGSTKLLAFKNNSGYGAINLAAALGANPIYLLGFDMHGNKQGKQKWWHDGYPVDYGENIYETYIAEISKFAPVLEKEGFEVVNLNPKSALKCFTFGNYKKVVGKRPKLSKSAIRAMTKPGMITAITPTGDRPLALALCKHWMEMQTVRPDQWIVVDDGKVPVKPPPGAEYVRRMPSRKDTVYTLVANLKKAIPYVKGNKILIIEDDEYYAPTYIERMSQELETHEVAGIIQAKYYHLPSGGNVQIANVKHASLAQTGFRASFLSTFDKLLYTHSPYLDARLWATALPTGRGYLFPDTGQLLYVGMKGMPGRTGIGTGHTTAMYNNNFDDIHRKVLKKWIPRDYQIYLDILSGKLTDENCNSYFPQITGVTVCYNSKAFMERAYTSVRKFHPDMPIIIVDGSDASDPCAIYVKSLVSPVTTVISLGRNIGHGKGMCMGIKVAQTPYALMFDSDIEMLKSPVDDMFRMMDPDTYGVGYTEKTGFDGHEYGARAQHANEGCMKMLHPYFHLLNIAVYNKFHPYVHHGAPCYLAARDIHEQGLTDKIIKEFPGLGHSSGKGFVWTGKPREFIRHDAAGTRHIRKRAGLNEIEGNWVRK